MATDPTTHAPAWRSKPHWHRLAAWLLLALAFAAMLPLPARAQMPTEAARPRPLAVPAPSARVIDQTGTLDSAQRAGLEARLAAFEQRKGSQIVVLMVPTTQPEDIASYANRVGNEWKIGRKDVGDGMLVIVAKDDRKMRIEVAKTLEGAVPDLAAARIIDEEMKPRFRNGDFAGGLNAAVDRLVGLVDGEPLPQPEQRAGSGSDDRSIDWGDFAIFLFFGFFAVAPVVRAILGKAFGTMVMGGGMGAVSFFITHNMFISVIAGLVALIASAFAGSRPAFGGAGGSGTSVRRRSSSSGSSWGGASSSGSSDWSSSSSSSSSGSFSSGGGGDFGGGGASGDW
ncbi:hypothetical protein VVAX_05222 [Variovorax paradoxus]|uniref:TPM domain-containing protein n=2 Tax=Variovorax paradoxus TaxID=34073 RepID=A0A679JRF6_VARPD|nr:hypothetical protein VVAX_05222 [Variovorax paradoxus]